MRIKYPVLIESLNRNQNIKKVKIIDEIDCDIPKIILTDYKELNIEHFFYNNKKMGKEIVNRMLKKDDQDNIYFPFTSEIFFLGGIEKGKFSGVKNEYKENMMERLFPEYKLDLVSEKDLLKLNITKDHGESKKKEMEEFIQNFYQEKNMIYIKINPLVFEIGFNENAIIKNSAKFDERQLNLLNLLSYYNEYSKIIPHKVRSEFKNIFGEKQIEHYLNSIGNKRCDKFLKIFMLNYFLNKIDTFNLEKLNKYVCNDLDKNKEVRKLTIEKKYLEYFLEKNENILKIKV